MKRALLNLLRPVMSLGHILPIFLFALLSMNSKADCPANVTVTPASANICAGDSVLMQCTDLTATTFQWFKDGTIMVDSTKRTCYAKEAGNYTVTTNLCGIPSAPVSVTLKPIPNISITTSSLLLCSGQQVTLLVNTFSNPDVVWAWIAPVSNAWTNTNPLTVTLTTPTTFQLVGANQITQCAITTAVTVQVKPPLTPGTIHSNTQVCPGGTPPLITSDPATGGSGPGSYGYQWQMSTTSATAGFVDIPGAISPTYQPGATTQTTWYRLVVSSPPCDPENSNAVVVQVDQIPTITSSPTKNICTGDNVNYHPSSNVAGTTYTWTASVTSAPGSVSPLSATLGSGNIHEVLSLPSGASVSGEVTYIITPTGPSASFCTGTPPFTLIVTIYPVALVTNFPLSQDICSGTTTSAIVLHSNMPTATFSWTATGTSGLSGYPASGTGDIPAMTISGLLPGAGQVEYTITPHMPGGNCPTGPPVVYTINVNPAPSITNSPMQQTICTGDKTVAVPLTSNIPGTTFTWAATASAGVSGFQVSGTNTIPLQTITNSSNVQGTVTYRIVPNASANGCPGIPKDYIVMVNPQPVVTAPQLAYTLCSGNSTNIPLSSTVAGTTFSWTASSPSAITGFGPGTGTVITQTLDNTSNANHTVTYVITPTSNGCVGNPISVKVTVTPEQVLTIVPASPTTCSGSNVVITLTGNDPGITFTWTASTSGNVTGFLDGSGPTISQTLTNHDNITRTVVYAVIMNLNGCSSGVKYFNVTVYPTPAITNNPLAATRCSGDAFNLALSSNVAGSTYSWTANSTPGITINPSGNGSTINETILNPTSSPATVTYTITPSANGCSGIPEDYKLTVNPRPDANLSLANQSICSGTSATAVSFSSAVAGTTYTWTATPSGAGISGYIASGSALIPAQTINTTLSTQGILTYAVTPSFNGCDGTTVSHIVTVNPIPVVINAIMTQTICNGATSANVNLQSNVAGTSFTWIATPSSPSITGYIPSGSTISIPAQTIYNSAVTTGTVTYQIIPTSNFVPACPGTPANYTITVNPSPTITSSLNESVCSRQPFTYAITADLAGTTFTWSRATVAGISNPSASGSLATINETLVNTTNSDINVKYILIPRGQAPSLCLGNPVTLTVKVRALPQTDAGTDITIAYGVYTSLSGTATGGTGGLNYIWTPNSHIASGSNSLTPQTSNLVINRTYTLSVVDASGCSSNDQMTVYVVGTPVAAVPISTPTDICVGGNTTINANATGGSGKYTYSWTSVPAGFTSTNATITVTPLINTQYFVTVNDGFNTVTSSVTTTVNPLPLQFGLTGGGSYCTGGSGVVVGLAGSQSGVDYQLYNNGNPVGTTISGTGSSISFGNQTLAGIYTVSATRVATGCTQGAGSSVSVSINALPVADAGTDQVIPYGTSKVLNGSVSGGFGIMNYSWNPSIFIASGGNTSSPITTNIYSNTTFTLNITDANGCKGTDQVAVSLNGNAVSVNALTLPAQICADASQSQLNASATGGAGVFTYSWTSIPAGSPAWTSTLQNPLVSPDVTTIYTVTADDGFNKAIASGTVVVNPLPLQYSVTGGGSYCYAGSGAGIGLSGSELNTNYQLFRGGVADGPAVTGTGNPISFGNRTAAFAYTVSAINNITGCTNPMNGNATIFITPPPLAYLITGGGSYPIGGAGKAIGLADSDSGISYQLYCNNVAVGAPLTGNETSLDFGLQTQAGTYTVVATNIATGCTANSLGSVDITVLPAPLMFHVTGGGAICEGEPGLQIRLSGSETGIDYQLLFNGYPQGALVAGTNLPLIWGPKSVSGLYEVRAVNSSFGTTQMMLDSAVIVVNPALTIYSVDPVGSQCPGTIIRLNGSDAGITYYLLMNGIPVDTLAGTGVIGFLDFGPQTVNGTYTIKGVNIMTGCHAMMNGSTYINIAPKVFKVIPAGILCPGQVISLTGSETGVNYQLRWNGTFDLGAPVAGTGSAIILGTAGLPGIYSAVGIDAITNCVSYMNDSATLYPDPTAFTVVPDGAACEGDLVGMNGSEVGVDYVLLLDNAIHLDTISGTGKPISFGPQFTRGNYTILAIDQFSYCIFNMNGTTVMNDSPIKYALLPAGIQCIGTTVSLSGSQPGISYQLLLNGLYTIGQPVAGTGNAISFGSQSLSGIYTIRGINDITGCNVIMDDSTIFDPLPVAFTVAPAGIHCAGTSIGLGGSEKNSYYILVLDGSINLDTIAGTGNAIDFGAQITAGAYSVIAYNAVSFCSSPMNGNSIIEASPVKFNMTPAGIACNGSNLGLEDSEIGITYQLRWNGSINIGAPVAGTGSNISFGVPNLPGTYSVAGTNNDGCVSIMNTTVEVNPLPVSFNIMPQGTQCQGTSLGLDGSEVNADYVLVRNGNVLVDTISGTGSTISFGPQMTSGNYSVIAFFTSTSCQSAMNGTSIITNVAPTIYTMTPAGIICAGANIGVDNSEIGATYQLRLNGTINMGSPVAGTGSAISFGIQTLPGVYTAIATNSDGCNSMMMGNVLVNPNPVAYNITPSSNSCPGTLVGTDGSESGVNYILILDGAINIDTLAGNGLPLSFGIQTTSGSYAVIAYNAATLCQTLMNGNTIIKPAPIAFNLTPSGFFCTGANIGIDNSETSAMYQLRLNASVNIGPPVAGTGSAISFGIQTLPGIYTVEAAGSNGCTAMMNASVVINPNPVVFTQLPSGNHCPGTVITLNGSEKGLSYVLIRDAIFHVDTLKGTGSSLSFGAQIIDGTYMVVAVSSVASCPAIMNGTTTILVGPTAFNVTPAGIVCSGNTIGLDNSESGVNYQLRRNGSINVGAAVSGTGSAISFGIQNLAGTYTVTATNANGCFNAMNNSIVVNPLPVSFIIIPSGLQCQGTSLGLGGSEANAYYVLMLDGTIPIDTVSGTGSPITFGPKMTSGNYTIFAYNKATKCQSAMNGTSVISKIAPAIYNMTPAGNVCAGSNLGVDNSEIGVSYQLRRNGSVNIGAPVAGTGSAISFGMQNVSGIYTSIATNSNGCNSLMAGTIIVNPNPTAFSITPSGAQCVGATLGLNGTEKGINYILVLNGSLNIDTLAGNGAPISFGTQTTSGLYTVSAYNTTTHCQAQMNGITTINPAPDAFNITPSGIICIGASLGLDNSEIGVMYQLRRNTSINVGIPVAGTGYAITFGPQHLAGQYTVVATNASNCSSLMNGIVVLDPLPTPYNITPSGVHCQGTSIGVDGSKTGTNYVLILNGTIRIDTIAGNGGPISFGTQSTSGTYTVTGYASSSCQQVMNGTTILISAPSVFNMTPEGIICTGIAPGIDGSDIGVNYQLRRDGILNVGLPVAGTGSSIHFSVQTLPGTYTVEAAGSNGCTAIMNGIVVMNASSVVFTQMPAGNQCAGTVITLNGSETGINYILYRDGIFAADTLAGTGSTLNFGVTMIAGTYTITAFSGATSCQVEMNGSTKILVNPTAFTITPAGVVCSGTTIGLDDSEAGVIYQLSRDGITTIGSPVNGTGSAIGFGVQNLSGTYSVIATNNEGCSTTMSGKVEINPVPVAFNLIPTGTQCQGTILDLVGSEINVSYVLVRDGNVMIDTITGTGARISFGQQLASGSYSVIAFFAATYCQSTMIGVSVILPQSAPAIYSITPAGISCGSANIGLDNSEKGIFYQLLLNGSVSAGAPIAGTGLPISFGIQTLAGIYTVTATNSGGCTNNALYNVTVGQLPIADFSYKGGECDSLVTFEDKTYGTYIARWKWNFGDGKSKIIDAPQNPNLKHYYSYPGVYKATLITWNETGCSDTITKTILRTPCLAAAFKVSDEVVCQKRSMKFTESSTCQAPIASWTWYFGDNTSVRFTTPQPFIEHTYAIAGNYTAKLVVATQMVGGMITDTASSQVSVKPAAKALYKWQDVCVGNVTLFDNQTQNNNTTIKSYQWNFGDPASLTDTTSAKQAQYRYDVFGQYDVKLVVTNTLGCTDTIINKINIFESPAADFTWNNNCEARPVYFTDQSVATSSDIVNWNWRFSSSGEVIDKSTERNCTFNFAHAGIYDADMMITDKNGCSTTIKKQVTVVSNPVAAFDIIDNYEDQQGQIMISNGTINGTNYYWDFGNGKKSYGSNPVVTFDKEGSYTIQLITWNDQNCTDTLSMLYDLMYKGLYVPNAFNPGHIDPEVAVFKPIGTNLKLYNVGIYDRWGNLIWKSDKLDNNGSPAEAWDGTVKGILLQQDVYVWKISAQFVDGEIWDGRNAGNNDHMPQATTGTVTLLR